MEFLSSILNALSITCSGMHSMIYLMWLKASGVDLFAFSLYFVVCLSNSGSILKNGEI